MNDMTFNSAAGHRLGTQRRLTLAPVAVPALGVVIVAADPGTDLLTCLETLLAARDVRLRIVVVDTGSDDDATPLLRAWAAGRRPYMAPLDLPFVLEPSAKPLRMEESHRPRLMDAASDLLLIHAGADRSFAAGVNQGIASLLPDRALDRFWILDPHMAVPADTPRKLALHGGTKSRFSILGGRMCFMSDPDLIVADGGHVHWLSGATSPLNRGRRNRDRPEVEMAQMDFVPGECMVASRIFCETAGPMREDYPVDYAEVDWAQRRGNLPLATCPDALVYHRVGSQRDSALAAYLRQWSRMAFLARFNRKARPAARMVALASAARSLARGKPAVAMAVMNAALGRPRTSEARDCFAPRIAGISAR